VLVNSIWWKGAWSLPFPVAATRTLPFTDIAGRETPTPLMTVRGEYRATERGGTKAIEIPFVGDEVAMVVLLPKNAPGLQRLERELTPAEFARWVDRLEAAHSRNTVLTLPRMRLRWRQDLASTLSAMGAPTPFGDDADFSGIAAMPYPGEIANAIGLKIKRVIHQTFFDLDEHGAEAAAATAVVMEVVVSGRSAAPPPPFVFRADHPFLFMLRDRRTGAILFMGRYVSPEPR
jgi:serpin B